MGGAATIILAFLTFAAPLAFGVESISPAITSSFGANFLSDETSTASFTLEPELFVTFTPGTELLLYTIIERPLDSYRDFGVPKVRASLYQELGLIPDLRPRLIGAVSGLSVHRWSSDGMITRTALALEVSREISRGLQLILTVGTFGQFAEFTTTTAGKTIPRFGLTQSLGAVYETGRTVLEAKVSVEQRRGTEWSNDYATYEAATYRFSDTFALGISHELLSSLVDDSTGLYRPITFFDGRDSRFSTFVTWTI